MSTYFLRRLAFGSTLFSLCNTAFAHTPETAPTAAATGWQACYALPDDGARLTCFDAWAAAQTPANTAGVPVPAPSARTTPSQPVPAPTVDHTTFAATLPPASSNCYAADTSSMLRFYELRRSTACETFKLRGYLPQSVSLNRANHINTQPSTPTQPADAAEDYQKSELRIQLSVRTKIAEGLLTPQNSDLLDSLWLGYSQLSFWQVFNEDLSRPFRVTDHQPEIFYVYPTEATLPLGWRLRYSGVGLVHHSNGQSDPLSRSWNRAYLMAGAEWRDRWKIQVKAWKRFSERYDHDDNPDMQNYWGRSEATLLWHTNPRNTLMLTARGSLGKGYGSGRLEWLHALDTGPDARNKNLRLHVQLFSGYGDSLIDYNRKRTSLSIGLSLLDF